VSSISRHAGTYLYVAATPDGGRAFGRRRAHDRRQLAEVLRRERLVPLRSWALPEWAGVSSDPKLRLKDQAELNTQLAQLLSRGVPLVEALEVTAGAVGPEARPKLLKMRELVAGGSSFADSCMLVGGFDRVTVAVYRAAERTGDLTGAARQLATAARRQLAIQGKAGTLLIYPAIVISLSVIMATMMIVFIVPKIADVIKKNTGKPLPWFTEVLVTVGETLRDYWPFAILTFLALLTAAVFGRKALASLGARIARRLPGVRDLLLSQEQTRFFTVMAAMTKNGVPLADALGVGQGVISHPTLRRQLATLQARLIEGGALRVLLDGVSELPMPTRRLLIAAERAGDLTSAFDTLASDSAEDVDRRSQRLLAALEPMLIVLMFLVIGSVLLSIMIPLMKLPAQIG
jgi:type II secretory pathway component PulF